MSARLTSIDGLKPGVVLPGYDRDAHGAGIVHIGLGAFHKAHQAVYTDDALAARGGDWRIIGVSLRSTAPAEDLTAQDDLYTLLERSVDGTVPRVIGALHYALSMQTNATAVRAALCAEETKIVTLTVTEKGYGIDRTTGGIDRAHPAIAADLAAPEAPQGVAGLLVRALGRRRAKGLAPFTVLCCDNLPENGKMVRSLLIDHARQVAPELVEHIATEVAFPSSMVDRITPAQTPDTLKLAEDLTGFRDAAAVETEAFRQWVIEDHFPQGRPAWEAGGAIFVSDVSPYEEMKLRMLNGAHSMLAYSGFLSGHGYVRDVMRDPALAALVGRHMRAAAATLKPLPGADFESYAEALLSRFENPHLAHETYQIAMDGTEKLPQRILGPAVAALSAGSDLSAFAFATAAWMRYTLGRKDDGTPYALRDPRETELTDTGTPTATALADRLLALPGLFPAPLRDSTAWREAVTTRLDRMMTLGMPAAVEAEAGAA